MGCGGTVCLVQLIRVSWPFGKHWPIIFLWPLSLFWVQPNILCMGQPPKLNKSVREVQLTGLIYSLVLLALPAVCGTWANALHVRTLCWKRTARVCRKPVWGSFPQAYVRSRTEEPSLSTCRCCVREPGSLASILGGVSVYTSGWRTTSARTEVDSSSWWEPLWTGRRVALPTSPGLLSQNILLMLMQQIKTPHAAFLKANTLWTSQPY